MSSARRIGRANKAAPRHAIFTHALTKHEKAHMPGEYDGSLNPLLRALYADPAGHPLASFGCWGLRRANQDAVDAFATGSGRDRAGDFED